VTFDWTRRRILIKVATLLGTRRVMVRTLGGGLGLIVCIKLGVHRRV